MARLCFPVSKTLFSHVATNSASGDKIWSQLDEAMFSRLKNIFSHFIPISSDSKIEWTECQTIWAKEEVWLQS